MPVDYSVFHRMLNVVSPNDKYPTYKLPDDIDQRMLAAFEIMRIYLTNKNNNQLDRALLGVPDDCEQKLISDIYLLIYFLIFIYQERVIYGETDGSFNEKYIDMYCCRKIREAFLCRGIKTQDLMSVFGLFGLIEGQDLSVFLDGIGFMSIESTVPPINRISNKD